MGLGEFELIERYFTRPARRAVLGVGDDCAVLAPTPGMQLCVSSDMLVEGRHFLSSVAPQRLGHKALAVNLSDLAACGAEPLACTLALALPRADEVFLQGFADGLWALAERHAIELVGGDTTAGPLNICITAIGQVPAGQALLRSGARAGDELWVSGTLGDARAALEVLRGTLDVPGDAFTTLRRAMELPEPRRRPRPAAARRGQQRHRSSATACSATWAMCCAARRSARGSMSMRCRAARSWPHCRRPCSESACCTAATTTSCCSLPHRRGARRCSTRRARPACRSAASAASKPGDELVVTDGRGQSLAVERGGFDHFKT